jgi:hypothetical protein
VAKYGRFAVDEILAVQKQHMKVDIQIQGAAESLDQGYRPGLGSSAGTPGLLDEMGLDGPVDEAEHPAHDLGPAREQKSELEGKAQHPLAHGQVGQDLVDQQRGAFDHPAGAAAGAKAPPFAAEGDQPLSAAILAPHPQEAVLQNPALEEIVEFALHVCRQRAALGG